MTNEAFQRTISSAKAEFVVEAWLESFIFTYKSFAGLQSGNEKKILRDFGIVAPESLSTPLGLYPLTWAEEESLKFLQFNWKGRQRVRTVRHSREKLHSVLCI